MKHALGGTLAALVLRRALRPLRRSAAAPALAAAFLAADSARAETEVEIWSGTLTIVHSDYNTFGNNPPLDFDSLTPTFFHFDGVRREVEIGDIGARAFYWTDYSAPASTRKFAWYRDGKRFVIGTDPAISNTDRRDSDGSPIEFTPDTDVPSDGISGLATATDGLFFRPDIRTAWATRIGGKATYRFVEILADTNADLSQLALSAPDGTDIPLNETFSASTTSYTATAPYSDGSRYEVTLHVSGAAVRVSPDDADGNAANGHQLRLALGETTVKIRSTAGDGTTTKDYTLTVTRPATDVCARTEAVRDAIVAAVSGVMHCKDLTPAHLAGIRKLPAGVDPFESPSFASGDFAGLSGLERLDIRPTEAETLPAGLFDGLGRLKRLWIQDSLTLTTLSVGLFRGLGALEDLLIRKNRALETLPRGLFDGLRNLRVLNVTGVTEQGTTYGLTSLPVGIFRDLRRLDSLALGENKLTTLSPDVFEGLGALRELQFSTLDSLEFTAGLFDRLTGLEILYMSRTAPASLPDGLFERLTGLVYLGLDSDNTIGLRREDNFPVAEAGPDLVAAPGAKVTLDGGWGASPWNGNVTYAWEQVDSEGDVLTVGAVALEDADTAAPSFTAPASADELHFQLTVMGRGGGYVADTDINQGFTPYAHSDTVTVTVAAQPPATADAALSALAVTHGAPPPPRRSRPRSTSR